MAKEKVENQEVLETVTKELTFAVVLSDTEPIGDCDVYFNLKGEVINGAEKLAGYNKEEAYKTALVELVERLVGKLEESEKNVTITRENYYNEMAERSRYKAAFELLVGELRNK